MSGGGGDLVEEVFHRPVVGHVESFFLKLGHRCLGEHEHVGLHPFEGLAALIPEVGRNLHGHVAAEAVDIDILEPEAHGVDHAFAHLGVRVVEHVDVGPVVDAFHVALFVALIPVGMFGDPYVVAARMVGHPVEYYLHAEAVCLLDEVFEFVECSVFGIELFIIFDGIVAAERAFAVFLADWVDRHEPENVDAEIFQAWKLFGEGCHGARVGILAHVDLIDDGVAAPVGVVDCCPCRIALFGGGFGCLFRRA